MYPKNQKMQLCNFVTLQLCNLDMFTFSENIESSNFILIYYYNNILI